MTSTALTRWRMTSPPANANGHRRRQLRARVLAEETRCALGGELVDKTLGMMPGVHGRKCKGTGCNGCVPHPYRAEVDEDLPRARGGSPYDRDNTHLMCRYHNQLKGTRTIAEFQAINNAQQAPTTITNIIQW